MNLIPAAAVAAFVSFALVAQKDPPTGAKAQDPKSGAPVQNQQPITPEYFKPTDTRSFTVEYIAKVPEVPAGTKSLRVWMPVPQDSTVQVITELAITPKPQFTTEPKYGNKIAYWVVENPGKSFEATMKFRCARTGMKVDAAKVAADGQDPAGTFEVFKQPDVLVTIDDEIKKLSNQLTVGKTTTMDRARAIYEYTVEKMTYDKSGQGWGTGSTKFACDVGKGNCTDFHALFNSLCRAQGIASGFEIGLYLPYERKKDEKLGGYHCWALFRVPGKTWVPVDCSEADRFAERKDFFFGGHTSNRVTLSTGRDITLEPKQGGAPLNYFLNPYAEADGKAVKAEKDWKFQDLDS